MPRKPAPKTPEQRHRREGDLLTELQAHHGYALADTLPDRDRSSMMADRAGGKLKLSAAVVIKLFVPADGTLGKAILRDRKKAAALKQRLQAAKAARTKDAPCPPSK